LSTSSVSDLVLVLVHSKCKLVSKSIFRVHSVSQRLNLRHLGEPLGGAKSLLEAVSFKKVTESMGRGRVANARWE